jgi:hypothetical protein
MNFNTTFAEFPKEVKLLIGAFLIVLSVGYFTGFRFVNETTENTPTGIQENYLGNEDDLEAEVMKFKKPKREMLTIIHTHILSMSVIFFILGGLVSFAKLPAWLKKSLMLEPLLSVLLTFGGIYLFSIFSICSLKINSITKPIFPPGTTKVFGRDINDPATMS